jgi:hypothetical protein
LTTDGAKVATYGELLILSPQETKKQLIEGAKVTITGP